MKLFGGLPLWGAIAILGAVLVIAIYLTDLFHSFVPLIVAIAVDAVVGALFLREYSERPLAEKPVLVPGSMASLAPGATPTAASTFPQDDTEFDDPVIEADRIDSGLPTPRGEDPPGQKPAAPKPPTTP